MATNTLAGTTLERLAALTLDSLVTEVVPLMSFVTDFSADAVPQGNTVTTRIPGAVSTQNFAASKATANATTISRVITLDKYRGVSLGFNDVERSATDLRLSEMFVRPAVSAIVENVMLDALSVFTVANHADSTAITPANFDADAVSTLAQNLSTIKVPRTRRTIIIPPSYYGPLTRDNAIQQAFAYGGSEVIRENRVPSVHGFNIVEYTGEIPLNARAMKGVAFAPMSVAIAARGVVPPPAGTWYGNVLNIVEPVSGLPIQIREYYDGVELRYEWTCQWGVASGVPNSAWIIT
jgi:hypothetical protein